MKLNNITLELFWDNIDSELLEEFCRQKIMVKFKKQLLRNKIMCN